MSRYSLSVNRRKHEVDVPPETPLLWILREELDLTGTKFGCGIGQCGVCTVHLDGMAVPSCQVPVEKAVGREITTIEGLTSGAGQRVQRAWVALDVPQCGYCQPGQIMAAAALLATNPHPTDEDITAWMSTTLCRCGTYNRIRAAIHLAAAGDRHE